MPVARVLPFLNLYVELYGAGDSADARFAQEVKLIAGATKVTADFVTNFSGGGQSASTTVVDLDDDPNVVDLDIDEQVNQAQATRPSFRVENVAPISYSLKRNSFRVADEFDCEIPLALLPVPLSAIRAVTCELSLSHVAADAWGVGLGGPTVNARKTTAPFDFKGVAIRAELKVPGDGLPTLSLSFHDYIGLLAGLKPKPGQFLDNEIPISEAITNLLKGTAAEGLDVVWVDPNKDEPDLGAYAPKLFKSKKGKKSKKPAAPTESILEIITHACEQLGCTPRMNVDRIEIARAGTIFQGLDRGGDAKATVLVGQIVESITSNRELVGAKVQPVQVVSWDPDLQQQYTARWPPDPKAIAAVTIAPGAAPSLPPLLSNLGVPGASQLDESVRLIPIAPVSDPKLLPQLAEMYWFELQRQRVKIDIVTHSPWSDPSKPDVDDLLHLVAGDNIKLGFIDYQQGELMRPEVRILSGDVSATSIADLLRAAGIDKTIATSLGEAIASVPRVDLLRVNETTITGGQTQDAEITISLASFIVVDSDLQAKGHGVAPQTIVQQRTETLPALIAGTAAEASAAFAQDRSGLDDTDEGQTGPAGQQLDALESRVSKARSGT